MKKKPALFLSFVLMFIASMLMASAPNGQAGLFPHLDTAIFAGGCFWCMQPAFDDVPGVIRTVAGYTGGHVANPSYEEVSSGTTGHAESVEVFFDPAKVSYRKLLDVYWHNIDPTTPDQEFCDVGNQYRTVIFYGDSEQEREAKESEVEIAKEKKFSDPIVTEILPASAFYPAEEHHQEYCRTNPVSYSFYRYNCGRDKRLRELWGDQVGGH